MNFGLGMPNLAESGVKMICKVKISGVSAQTFILQVRVTIVSSINFNNDGLWQVFFAVFFLVLFQKGFKKMMK